MSPLPLLKLFPVFKPVHNVGSSLVLNLNEALCFLRVQILHPPVRISHSDTVLSIGDIGAMDGRIENLAVQGGEEEGSVLELTMAGGRWGIEERMKKMVLFFQGL